MVSIEKYSLGQQVFHRLREAILNGEYPEGMLLQEIKISEEFGVSRTPVREAIKQLELEGLVSIMPNKGAKVQSISAEDIKDIYDIRCLIEGLAARWAAEKITDEQLDKMQESIDLEEFYLTKDNMTATANGDSNFHKILYDACDSKYLQHILTDFHRYAQMERIKSLSTKGRAPKSIEEHKAILEALKAHNAEKAEKAATQHVKNAKESLLKNMK